jgi:hypothetical protein
MTDYTVTELNLSHRRLTKLPDDIVKYTKPRQLNSSKYTKQLGCKKNY